MVLQINIHEHQRLDAECRLFVSPSLWNLQLQAGSPAVNTGVTLTQFTTDFLGVSRPQGSAWDRGAYERSDAPQPPPIGNVAKWPFDGNAQDASGRGHHGTLVGDASASGPAIIGSNALSLDGTGDRVTVPGHADLRPTTTWGVSAWIKMNTIGPNGCVILSNGARLGMWIRNNGLSGCWVDGGSYVAQTQHS